ncbi:MAG: hypothetical protein FJX75_24250 [Armatimonadetes bacterium]|nr:hypothetical protein [Armatimonadota bacterium]
MTRPPDDVLQGMRDDLAAQVDPDAEEAIWEESDLRELLAEYGPEDEGLYDDPEALGARPMVW